MQMLTDNPQVLCGGKVVLLGGDMGQVLPVIDGVPPSGVVHYSLPAWEHWNSCRRLTLIQNMRAITDPAFASYLMTVRDGKANVHGSDEIIVPEDMLVKVDSAGLRRRVDEEVSLVDALVQNVR